MGALLRCAFEETSPVHVVADAIGVHVRHAEHTTEVALGFSVAGDKSAAHELTKSVVLLGVGVGVIAVNQGSESDIVVLQIFDLSARERGLVCALNVVVAHLGGVVEVDAGKLDEGVVVVADSASFVVVEDLGSGDALAQREPVCGRVVDVGADLEVGPLGPGGLPV